MGETKPKTSVRRRAVKAASSPIPASPSVCGHDGCGGPCAVRYVGPTSHVRDHHIVHAARGVTHIWAAAIITGFALVVTAAIGFNSAQAATDKKMGDGQMKVKQDLGREIKRLSMKIEDMEKALKQVAEKCAPSVAETE